MFHPKGTPDTSVRWYYMSPGVIILGHGLNIAWVVKNTVRESPYTKGSKSVEKVDIMVQIRDLRSQFSWGWLGSFALARGRTDYRVFFTVFGFGIKIRPPSDIMDTSGTCWKVTSGRHPGWHLAWCCHVVSCCVMLCHVVSCEYNLITWCDI